MADRGMSASMIAELSKDLVSPAYLVRLGFDSGDLRMTDAARDITWSGNTYLRTNGLLSFQGLAETGELLVNTITVTLSGVDTSAAMAKVLTDDFLDRPLEIWIAFLTTAGAVIVDPLKIFSGRMDGPVIAEDPDEGSCTVAVKGTPAWADFGRRPGRHTNNAEQQFYYAGDLGFEYVSQLPKLIKWGRA